MSIKWPRRRLLAMAGAVGALGGLIFPEMSLKAQAATITEDPWSRLQLIDTQEITGPELATVHAETVSTADIHNCGGPLDFSKAECKAARHTVASSANRFLAIAWFFPTTRHLLVYWQLDEAVNHLKTRAFLYQLDAKGEQAGLISLSINTHPVRLTGAMANSLQPNSDPPCSDFFNACSSDPHCTCDTGYPNYPAPVCCGINWGYVAGCCGACIFAGELAGVCVLVFCPICVVANACSGFCGTVYCC